MFLTESLTKALHVAAGRNGWELVGLLEHHHGFGEVSNGLAVFQHRSGEKLYGTARWISHPDKPPYFESGHYDLSREDAVADFAERCVRKF